MNLVRRVESLESRPLVRVVPPEPAPLDTPADVLSLLEEQMNAVRADPLVEPSEKARTLGFLGGLALRAMEARDVVARLEAVERVLKLRREGQESALQNGKRRRW
jgi:hypothetical protein